MPHHGLRPIIEDAWFLQGSVNFNPVFRLQRNMVVLREGNDLTLVNAIRLDEEGEASLHALGAIRHVVKIGLHGMDDAYYGDRFRAQCWALPHLTEELGATPLTEDSLPHAKLSLFTFELTKEPEAALLFASEGGLLITCDSVQHWETSDLMNLPGKFAQWMLGFHQPAQIGPPWRSLMTPKGGSLKPDFERLVKLPFTRLIGGHGGLCSAGAQAALRATIARVYPS